MSLKANKNVLYLRSQMPILPIELLDCYPFRLRDNIGNSNIPRADESIWFHLNILNTRRSISKIFFSLVNTYAANVYNTALNETLEIVLPMLLKVETCNTIHFQYWIGKTNHWKALKNVKMWYFMKCIACI